jgi:hypothetical protein
MSDDDRIRVTGEKIMRDLQEGNPEAPILGGTGEIKLTEDEWDSRYGGAINESPLHLSPEQLNAITEGHIWTQVRR